MGLENSDEKAGKENPPPYSLLIGMKTNAAIVEITEVS